MHVTGFRPLAAVPYTPAPGAEDPHAHDKHYDPHGPGTPPLPKPDTGVDPKPPSNRGPMCGHGKRSVYM